LLHHVHALVTLTCFAWLCCVLLCVCACVQVMQSVPDLYVLVVSHENITNNWWVRPWRLQSWYSGAKHSPLARLLMCTATGQLGPDCLAMWMREQNATRVATWWSLRS
jgi:hypothetical protein